MAVLLLVGCGAVGTRYTVHGTRNGSIGVLVLAHGGTQRWNQTVEQTVAEAGLPYPTEVAFGMGMHAGEVAAMQQTVERLAQRGVGRIVIVPLLISSASDVIRQYEYLFGLRAHGPWEEEAKPIPLGVPVMMASPLDDDPLVAQILLERARSLSRRPTDETVVVIAHGPASDEDETQWLATMGRMTASMQERGGFRAVIPATMRDDAPTPVQEAATRRLRQIVDEQSRQGRVLVVPLLLANGGVESKIPARLKGLTFAYEGQALLPHPNVARWIAHRVDQAVGSAQVARADRL